MSDGFLDELIKRIERLQKRRYKQFNKETNLKLNIGYKGWKLDIDDVINEINKMRLSQKTNKTKEDTK